MTPGRLLRALFGTVRRRRRERHLTMRHIEDVLEAAEREAAASSTEDCLQRLRALCLDDFALVLLDMPDARYPRLSAALPAMAPEKVQREWTGASGVTLLRQRVAFLEKVRRHFARLTGRSLEGARILDYGCGYGMMLRLMYYLTDLANLAGCDPWPRAIGLCEEAGIECRLDVTDYLPASLPYDDETFDLVLAFSVFTHTSRRASVAALEALRPIIRPDGLLVVTVRPREYWAFNAEIPDTEKPALLRAHDDAGFAFRPHHRPPVDGDVTYGDTSMRVDTLERLCPAWRTVGYDRSLHDALQLVVLLQPAGAGLPVETRR